MSTLATSPQSLTITPAADRWGDLIRRDPLNETQSQFRTELGLPTDKPIIMTGHQAQLWHPGILAKYIAAAAAADLFGAHAAWLVADQDAGDPGVVEQPIEDADGHVRIARHRLGGDRSALAGVPTGLQPPLIVDEDIDAIEHPIDRLRAREGEPSAAKQIARTLDDLLEPMLGRRPSVFALDIPQTSLFAMLLSRIREDPAACMRTYDDAVRAFPDAGVAPLRPGELPLWRVAEGEPRRRVSALEVETLDPASLAPRALLMTGIMQLAGCDLFIHGTGGGRYVRAGDHWLRAWLGNAMTERLAPTAVVTATCVLPIPGGGVSPDEAGEAISRVHRARNNPALLGDDAAAAEKARLLDEISRRRAAGENPRAVFDELRTLVDRSARAHEVEIARLESEAAEYRSRVIDGAIARRRDWAWVLYPDEMISGLDRAIRAAFGGVA